jgi:hypothetical protein
VALEVEECLSGNVTDFSELDLFEGYPPGLETFHVIEFGRRMDRSSFIPVLSDDPQPFIHRLEILIWGQWLTSIRFVEPADYPAQLGFFHRFAGR